MTSQVLIAAASAVCSLIVVPAMLYGAKYYWDRRRWSAFERHARQWANLEFGAEDLTEDDWKSLAAIKLMDGGFEPAKVKEYLDLAVWFAKGLASQIAFDKIGFRQKERPDERDRQPDIRPK